MYTLRFPFKLPGGNAISHPQFDTTPDGLSIGLKLHGLHYVLTLSGFEDEIAARAKLDSVQAAMNWVLLVKGLAHIATYELQPVHFYEDSRQAAQNFMGGSLRGTDSDEELNAVFDASRPAVYPSDGTYRTLEAQPVTVSTSIHAEDFAAALVEGLGFREPSALLVDQRLLTALDLYRAHFSEATPRARFLTLVMVLEALAEPARRPRLAVELIGQFGEILCDAEAQVERDSDEANVIEALKREIVFRKDDSIRSRIRTLVTGLLHDKEPDEQKQVARRALSVYDARSDLLHTGSIPDAKLNDSLTEVKEIVHSVLRIRFLQTVEGDA